MTKLPAYVKAGRVIRLYAWIQVVAIVGIVAAIVIPMISDPTFKTPLLQHRVVFFLMACLIVFQFAIGKAIKEHKDWGRTVGIIYGILSLFSFPIGTLIGAYVLWCLIKGWDEQPA
jgi:hypothetical protein